MADIYGFHFEYKGRSSQQHDLVIARLNTGKWTRLHGASESITIYSKGAHRNYLIDDDHSKSPVSFDIELVTEDGRTIDMVERRCIEKWLFNSHNYSKLYFDISDDLTGETYEFIDGKIYRNYLNCRFVNPEKIEGNGGVVGYKVKLEADSNMFWQDAVLKTFSVKGEAEGSNNYVVVDVDTDFHEYIYPKVSITLGSAGGDIIIVNDSDDNTRQTKFKDMSPLSTVTMNGELNYVNDQYYNKFSDRNFIRLLDGENRFMVVGNVDTITFEYSARRMM